MTNTELMKAIENFEEKRNFFSQPKIIENYSFLYEVGVFDHISYLEREIKTFKNLFVSMLDVFAHTTIEKIIDAAVLQVSNYSLPSSIVFLWKPLQYREKIAVKAYKKYKPVDLKLSINNINEFELFFQKYSKPIDYKLFLYEFGNNQALKDFDHLNPSLIIPILGPSSELYGMVLMGKKVMGEEYGIAELTFIHHLMSFVSIAIQNNLHYEHSLRDGKTGLFNSGFFITRLNEEIVRTKRTGTESSVVILDVDRFKRINDAFGHIAGDRVLEDLAVTIKQVIRGNDVPSRFGGEEFTLLLPDSNRFQAFQMAERLREIVSQMKVAWEPPLPQITVSLGIFTFGKDTDLSAADIIGRADEALYMSKELGRNRSTEWGKGLLSKINLRLQQNSNSKVLVVNE